MSGEAGEDQASHAPSRLWVPDAQAFIKRRIETGSTKREAVRLLKRKLANVVYRNLVTDAQPAQLAEAA